MAINSLFMQAYPAVFEQLAFDSGTFTRARKIKSPAQLMHAVLWTRPVLAKENAL